MSRGFGGRRPSRSCAPGHTGGWCGTFTAIDLDLVIAGVLVVRRTGCRPVRSSRIRGAHRNRLVDHPLDTAHQRVHLPRRPPADSSHAMAWMLAASHSAMSPASGIAGHSTPRVSHRSRMVVLNVFRADVAAERPSPGARGSPGRPCPGVLHPAQTVPAARPLLAMTTTGRRSRSPQHHILAGVE